MLVERNINGDKTEKIFSKSPSSSFSNSLYINQNSHITLRHTQLIRSIARNSCVKLKLIRFTGFDLVDFTQLDTQSFFISLGSYPIKGFMCLLPYPWISNWVWGSWYFIIWWKQYSRCFNKDPPLSNFSAMHPHFLFLNGIRGIKPLLVWGIYLILNENVMLIQYAIKQGLKGVLWCVLVRFVDIIPITVGIQLLHLGKVPSV